MGAEAGPDRTSLSKLLLTARLPRYTGGQYSLVRAVFAIGLMGYLLGVLPEAAWYYSSQGLLRGTPPGAIFGLVPSVLMFNDSPVFVTLLVLFAALLTIPLAAGWFDRVSAALLWYVLASLHWRWPAASDATLPLIGWLLLAHVLTPPRPYGAWSGRHRADAGASWRMPLRLHVLAWMLLALAYSATGLTRLTAGPALAEHAGALAETINARVFSLVGLGDFATMALRAGLVALTLAVVAVEVAFVPLALSDRTRPLVWCWTLIVHQVLLGSVLAGQTHPGLLMLHVFCFDPAWIRPRASGTTDLVFYNARCGLCHACVRFLLSEDWKGAAFRYAAGDSQTAHRVAERAGRAALGNHLAVLVADGRLLVRSTAALHLLHRIGGLWSVLADIAALVPRVVRDPIYCLLAGAVRRLYHRPAGTCPVADDQLHHRFEE